MESVNNDVHGIIVVQDNAVLCNEVNDKVVQHFVQCIETHGKHVQVSSCYFSAILVLIGRN